MESIPRFTCVSCSSPCTQFSGKSQGTDVFYETFYCTKCGIENYARKCGYCSGFVSSLLKADVSPGAILKCPNQACKKEFQYLTCPNSSCREVICRPGNFMMGTVTQCDYCDVTFQDVTCNLCHTENYFRGDPEQSYYISGVRTNCRSCKETFLQFCCPTCKRAAYADAKTYHITKPIKCENCQSRFKQTTCPGCKRSNFYVGNTLKFGMVEKCACKATYRTYICESCGEIEHKIVDATNSKNDRKITEHICRKCKKADFQAPCSACGLPCYNIQGGLTGAKSVPCLQCGGFYVHLFNCSYCKCSYFGDNKMTTCPNASSHPLNETSMNSAANNQHLFQNLLGPSASNGGSLNNSQGPSANRVGFGGLFGNSNPTTSNNGGTSLLSSSNGLFGSLGSRPPSNLNSGGLFRIPPSNNSNNGGLFSTQPSNNSNSGGLFSIQPSSHSNSGGLFGIGSPSSNNRGSLFGNSQVSSLGMSSLLDSQQNQQRSQSQGASLFSGLSNLQIKKPPTDDLTQKINDIKDSDDSPTDVEEKRCSVCLDNEKKVVYIPCGHLTCCLACTKAIMKKDKNCPICKQKITNFQRIYST